ncbi:bifunctional diaminohydroxyphosphoribosylaminopyrimidine deaminase/5-amino-6-(5-phosphoribosylamino)uracil reductase RibD [Salinisphaera sp. T31B1]|uniref:bifunctional diaminohydroxyphosphoribosylaminopyrimidine deaminase/5-amino-6-(5-phosphoribosylamino)uracil reductase RibD n=1 Tax=Salinisphaera sp. T31B1 TaxID=727963 RepID=UPI00334056E5
MNDTPVRRSVHAYYMQRAIELARRGWYTTRPNPRVGCVVVVDEQVVGEGWHERAGERHAEPAALADVEQRGGSARGATVYVTLEPCSHTGRTPPCVDTLIDAGVTRVVIGCLDPNPRVNGQGVARLRAAGIDVVTDILAEGCAALNTGFNMRMTVGRPRVRVKLAMSLDGRTAAASGQSQWITGDEARSDVHRLRAESGAVLIGRGTLLADDPSLTVRLPGQWPQPLRVVVDGNLEITSQARMLGLDGCTRVFTLSGDSKRIAALESAGARIDRVPANNGRADLSAVLTALAEDEINDVLVEAGPTLAGAFARAGLVDEFIIYMAPTLIGHAGRELLRLDGVTELDQALALHIEAIEPVGRDWRIRARPANTAEAGHNED